MEMKPLEMKGDVGVDDLEESDDDRQHQHLHDGADDNSSPSSSVPTSVALGSGGVNGEGVAMSGPALFDEYYDDWAAFDHAVALAIEKHHPIRKRSSLTFEVYNRTVSKGMFVCVLDGVVVRMCGLTVRICRSP